MNNFILLLLSTKKASSVPNRKTSVPMVMYEAGQVIPEYLEKNDIAVTMAELHEKIATPEVKGIFGQVINGIITESVSLQGGIRSA